MKKRGQGGQQARSVNPVVQLPEGIGQSAAKSQNKGGPEMSLHGAGRLPSVTAYA